MRIGRPFGIPVSLHPLFVLGAVLLLAWQVATVGLAEAAAMAALGAVVFGSVLLHELGHALAAKGVGIQTRSITLHPLGGLAALDREPRTPTEELIVSLAGPAVNAVLAVAGLALWTTGLQAALWVAVINAGMGLFNLLPAFPMDGGRVLRAALATRMARRDATEFALRVARGFGWLFVATALVGGWNLALIGGFLLLAGKMERSRLDQSVPAVRLPTVAFRERFAHPPA